MIHHEDMKPGIETQHPTQFKIFGYGSLIWKPPPHVIDRQVGFIKGFVRRFAQSSHDHRGTIEKPGRVVTLVPTEEWTSLTDSDRFLSNVVWGVVYTIDPTYEKDVKDYLDEREKDGYEMIEVSIYNQTDGNETLLTKASVYVGHTDNPSFAGVTPLDELSNLIHRSVGPSGPNKDYLYNLNTEVHKLCEGVQDPYLEELTELVSRLDA
ncbi:ChaC-like protein [Melampsora americana]|nr:ChaC-like protein [Melampsora americana]